MSKTGSVFGASRLKEVVKALLGDVLAVHNNDLQSEHDGIDDHSQF